MSTRTLAEQFINDQLEIMREHGKAPKLSAEQYDKAVASTEKTFAAMRHTEPKSQKKAPQGHAMTAKS
ncbi:MAG TPA: hypothetical protein VK612_03700 [Pyrinomonadaceae bacterium]|nr:hypothetical protein [Pyrinomonadaceae bacterium]